MPSSKPGRDEACRQFWSPSLSMLLFFWDLRGILHGASGLRHPSPVTPCHHLPCLALFTCCQTCPLPLLNWPSFCRGFHLLRGWWSGPYPSGDETTGGGGEQIKGSSHPGARPWLSPVEQCWPRLYVYCDRHDHPDSSPPGAGTLLLAVGASRWAV